MKWPEPPVEKGKKKRLKKKIKNIQWGSVKGRVETVGVGGSGRKANPSTVAGVIRELG